MSLGVKLQTLSVDAVSVLLAAQAICSAERGSALLLLGVTGIFTCLKVLRHSEKRQD